MEPTIIRSDDDLKGAVPLAHSRCFVVKLHGDYLDTRIKNTDQELSAYTPGMDGLLDRIFDDHGLIVCGWSGDWDHALRSAMRPTVVSPHFGRHGGAYHQWQTIWCNIVRPR